MSKSSRPLCFACLLLAAMVAGYLGAQSPMSKPVPTPPRTPAPEPDPGPPPTIPQQATPAPAIEDLPEPPQTPRERRSRRSIKDVLRGAEPMRSVFVPPNIDPKTPARDLLPTPPKARQQTPSAFVDDLSQVPELMLTEPFGKRPDAKKEMERILNQVARIDHLNAAKKDRFMEVLIAERSDLAGLPFIMGDACRTSAARSRHFARSVGLVHEAMADGDRTSTFLQSWLQICLEDDEDAGRPRPGMNDDVGPARVAAMMQICAPASDNYRLGMAKYIGSVSHAESSRALARIVLFTPEEEIRSAAISALAARKEKDYTDVLLQGLRYPWPAVGKRAADALVKLDRKDLIPDLVNILDEPDPRAPVVKKTDGKSVATVRELVRINHHRNCLMCHAPGHDVENRSVTPSPRAFSPSKATVQKEVVQRTREGGQVIVEERMVARDSESPDVLVAEVPVPGQPLPSFQDGGYQSQGIPELLVRIDVTYLRQDFSALLPVANAAPWPEQQRFDFVTRTRVLNEEELKRYQEKFDNLAPGVLPSNHKAALSALRELTGKDTAPTAEAWRKVLNIMPRPSDSGSKQARNSGPAETLVVQASRLR